MWKSNDFVAPSTVSSLLDIVLVCLHSRVMRMSHEGLYVLVMHIELRYIATWACIKL